MGATPKQRISRKHRGDRRSQQHIKALQLVECPQCHNPRHAALRVSHLWHIPGTRGRAGKGRHRPELVPTR